MGRYQEAKDLITGSFEELNKAGVLVGESQYYLALFPLLAADSEEAVAQADPMLMQVSTYMMFSKKAAIVVKPRVQSCPTHSDCV